MTAIDSSSSTAISHTTTAGSMTTKSTFLGIIAAYLMATDHTRIGRLLISFSAIFAIGAAAEGALLGAERISSSSSLVDAGILVQLFSAFRFDLIFAVGAPLMLGIAVAIVPMQIGARSLAFARGAQFGFYLWLFGVVLVGTSYLNNGGPGGGNADMVDLFLVGLGLVIAGLTVISASIATTVLTSRRAGMTLMEAPIFSWSALIASLSLIFTLPVMAGALIFVAVDHTYERATFGATQGVNAWIGWAFTANFSGGLSEIAKSLVPFLFFNAFSILGVLVVLGLCLLALKNEKAKPTAPFVPAFLGVGMVLTGMVGNAAHKISNFGLVNTVFEEAVLVYICYGVLLSSLGAIAHFGPRIWGREIPSAAVVGLGLLGFVATVLASLPYFIAGFADQPSGVADGFNYSGPAWLWNSIVAAGHSLMALVVLLSVALATKSFRSGKVSTATSADLYESVNG